MYINQKQDLKVATQAHENPVENVMGRILEPNEQISGNPILQEHVNTSWFGIETNGNQDNSIINNSQNNQIMNKI